MRPQDDKQQDKREEEDEEAEEQQPLPEELWETEGGSINPIPDAIEPTQNFRKR